VDPVLPAVASVLEAGRAEGIAPSLSAAISRRGLSIHRSRHGDGRFDVASLTKVLCTTTLAAQAVEAGALDLDGPVAALVPGFAGGWREAVTARHLLAHTSGLAWWLPLHQAPSREAALARLLASPLEAPPGQRAVYSDPGFILLGLALEAALRGRLPELFEARVARPLGLASTCFVEGVAPAAAPAHTPAGSATRRADRGVAPTGWSAARGRWLEGEVNDDVAWALGGAAGHAGLFSTALEVAAIGQAWLDALDGHPSIVPAAAAATFSERDPTPGSTRALGWDTPSPEGSTLGTRLGRGPRGALGHLGFTGCSLWLDLDAGLSMALLTNHVHPSGPDRSRLNAFRRRFHDAVAEAIGVG